MKRNLIVLGIMVLIVGGCFWLYYQQKEINKNNSLAITVNSTEQVIKTKTDFYEITAKYPKEKWDKNNVILQFINDQVEQRKEAWAIDGDVYNEEMSVAEQFPDRPKMIYTLNINYQKFESIKMGTISYVFFIEEYTGGANGNITVQTFTFDENNLMSIESFLNLAESTKDENKNVVYNDLILTKILKQKALTDSENFPNEQILDEGLGLAYLKSDGITLDHEKCKCDGWLYASNLQNFVVTDRGLIFYFNKFAITIGASGTPSIELDWTDLDPYLINKK